LVFLPFFQSFLFCVLVGALVFWGLEGSAECRAAGLPFPDGLVKWTYGNSCYFMIITFTTIGYGDLSPTTSGGRLFLVFFGGIGLLAVASALGYFISLVAVYIHTTEPVFIKRMKKWKCCKPGVIKFIYEYRVGLVLIFIYALLLIIGAVLFGWGEPFEPPKFINGLYFSFVTLTTIGYGNLVATHAGTKVSKIVSIKF
jgi:hypothetical protein